MQQPTPDQPPSRANTHSSEEREGVSQTARQALGMAILGCLAMSWASAQDPEREALPVDSVAHKAQPTTQGESSAELLLAPLVIEAQVTNPDLTQDQLMQKFRDALAQPSILILAEHRFSDGSLELTTRLGRFCARLLPGHLESGLGGDITLAAPCAWF